MTPSASSVDAAPKVDAPKWTPGPWVARLACFSNGEAFGFSVKAPKRGHSVVSAGVYEDTNLLVQDFCPADMREQFYTIEEITANAHMIASAPELYEALTDVLRIAKAASIGVTGNAKRIARAEAALARARGE